MASGGSGKSQTKQEEKTNLAERHQKTSSDCAREDGVRKELYEIERKARENWDRKWGFYKNQRKLCEEEALRLNIPLTIFKWNKPEEEDVEFLNLPPENLPKFSFRPLPSVSSGMIGWMSGSAENNLDAMTGPMYVSRKRTVKAPSSNGEEPDLSQQRYIILG